MEIALVAGTVLLAVTLRMLYARGLQKQYPWFVAYLWLVLGRAPILFFLRPYRTTYFYSYWIAETITVALSLLVIFEIYRQVLTSSGFNLSRSTFVLLTVALLALAAGSAFWLETADSPAMLRAILILSRTVRIVQVALLAILLVASLFFNFYWQSLPFGFALGYGVYATIELVAATFRSSLGPSGDTVFVAAKVLSYQLAVMVWIFFIWRHREQHALRAMPVASVSEWMRPVQQASRGEND